MYVRSVLAILLVVLAAPAFAAPGSGAPDPLLVVLVKGLAVAVVACVFVYCIKCLIRPGEDKAGHIKHRILRDDW